jgi:hypothetical protein
MVTQLNCPPNLQSDTDFATGVENFVVHKVSIKCSGGTGAQLNNFQVIHKLKGNLTNCLVERSVQLGSTCKLNKEYPKMLFHKVYIKE